MASRPADEVARDAWRWLKDAEAFYRKTANNSAEEMQAIQAMSAAALTAMTAEQAKY